MVLIQAIPSPLLSLKRAYLNEWLIRQLVRTNERSDYASDGSSLTSGTWQLETWAAVHTSGEDSPVNNELSGHLYADALASEAGIRTNINLADSAEELEKAISHKMTSIRLTTRASYEQGRVVFLNMGVDYRSDDFKAKLRTGLEFLIGKRPLPCACNERWTGLVWLSGLLGLWQVQA